MLTIHKKVVLIDVCSKDYSAVSWNDRDKGHTQEMAVMEVKRTLAE